MKIVDKEEFRIKLDQINHLVEAKDYKGAMEVVDSIDWRRVKNVRTLCVVGEIYAANKRYEDSRDIFLLAYHRASIGKNILVRLVEVCLKMGEIDEAMEYYEEFCSVAPNDNTAYILRYKILRARKAPLDDQIQVLEEYKNREFTEKWSYELAKLYYKAGLQDKAEDVCSEIILWFSEGNYVMKAYELKMKMGVITDSEKQRFEASQAELEKQKEEASKEEAPAEEPSGEKAPEEEKPEKELTEEASAEEPSEEKTPEEEISEEEAPAEEPSEEEAPEEEISEEEIPEEEDSKAASKEKKFTVVEEISSEEPSEEETEDQEIEELPESPADLEKEEADEGEPEKTGSDDIAGNESEDGEEVSEETGEEDSFEEEEEEDSSDDAEEAFEDDGSPLIDSIDINNEKELKSTETISEKIVKGLRDLFGGRRRAEKDDEEEDLEEDTEDELTEEQDEEVQFPDNYDPDYEDEEEETDSEASEEDTEDVSDDEILEDDIDDEIEEEKEEKPKKEPKKREFRFLLPRSKKAQKDVAEDHPEEEEKEQKTENREPEEEFNLEDTILAAAFEQGIDIPGSSRGKKSDKEETESDASGKDHEDDDEEPVIIEKMINDEKEKSIQSLEKKAKKSSEEESPDLSEDVPDLIMPDLNSLIDEEEEKEEEKEEKKEEEIILEKEEPDKNNDDFVAEIVEGENEEDIDEEEFLITGVIGEDDDEDSEIADEEEDDEDSSEEDTIEDFIESIQPKSLDDPINIIPRSKELTEEEIKLFSYFVIVPGMKEQIVDALYDVQIEASKRTSSAGNIIVMGGPESGKTRLISGLIPAICKELNLQASKVAYVFADQINGKDLKKVIQRLSGGFLVIENANQLDQETAVNLVKMMDGDTQGMIFILEDDKIGMRKMMARYPKLARKFTSVINIPVFTNDELANFAKIYAMENGYRIDNKGMLALYNMISINQKEDMPMNIGAVKEMVDAAIAKSQGGIAIFRKNASKKRTDQNGFIVLYEKDFVKGK